MAKYISAKAHIILMKSAMKMCVLVHSEKSKESGTRLDLFQNLHHPDVNSTLHNLCCGVTFKTLG